MNPPCNAEDNLRAGHLVIEVWFGGYFGSPGLRGPRASGLLAMGQTGGLRRYKDRRLYLCPEGTLLGVEGKLGDQI